MAEPDTDSAGVTFVCVSEAKGLFDVMLNGIVLGRLQASTRTFITAPQLSRSAEVQRAVRVLKHLMPGVRQL